MLSAQEMFQKQGFRLIENSDRIIEYFYDICDGNGIGVRFYKFDHSYKIYSIGFNCSVSVKLHNAIHQQLKELNWMDE